MKTETKNRNRKQKKTSLHKIGQQQVEADFHFETNEKSEIEVMVKMRKK